MALFFGTVRTEKDDTVVRRFGFYLIIEFSHDQPSNANRILVQNLI